MTTFIDQLQPMGTTGAPLRPTIGFIAILARVPEGLRAALNKVAEVVLETARRRADAYLYLKLCELSDAELRRRGLARDTLHQHVFGGSGNG